jgi:HSP20 family protein
VDVTETEKGYKVAAELPGMDEKNIEVKIANGRLTIKGEKQEEKEEEKQDYYVRERSFALSLCPTASSSTRLTPASRKAS